MGLSANDVAQMYRNQGKDPPPEFADAPAIQKRMEKYGRIKKEFNGLLFDSTLEANAYQVLKLRETCHFISDLELQPVFVLQDKQPGMRAIKYIPDFRFIEREKTVCVDAKGMRTAAFAIKAKIFRQKFPDIELQIWDRKKVKEMGG